MSKRSTSAASKTDWARVRAMEDREILRTTDHPEASVRHIVRGVVRQGLKPVPPKAAISLRLDADVLDWFKAQGPGYQTRINAVLRAFKEEAGLRHGRAR
ncbi:MAG: BrnA antitoxin family protein [Proteobacteria bacterium]|nr:BrnA antitoxin family protein [Pseudomonadota bacterium]